MKILFILLKVNILILLLTSNVFSQKGNDTIQIIDVKSIMEPYLNKNPDTIAYMFVQQIAVFPGGNDSLNSYVKTYLFRNSMQVVKNKTTLPEDFVLENKKAEL